MNIFPRIPVIFIGLSLLFTTHSVLATKIASVELDTLLDEARSVVLLTITEGTLTENKEQCGAQYQGVVAKAIKNSKNDTKISFLSRFLTHSDIEIGAQYIVFLNPLSKATTSACKNTTQLEVSHAGYGALRVAAPYQIDLDDAVRVPLSFIKIPSSLKSVSGTSSNLEVYESGWIEKSSFIHHLIKISK